MTAQSGRVTRRRVLVSCGGAVTAVLSGCTGTNDEPTYREGDVGQSDGEPRTAEQMVAAEALATTRFNRAANPLDSLVLESHEFAVEDGYTGPTVQGTVANTADTPLEFAEVRVRVYDADDARLGQYVATIRDFDGESSWQFQVILLNSVSDIAAYDIAVVGIPA